MCYTLAEHYGERIHFFTPAQHFPPGLIFVSSMGILYESVYARYSTRVEQGPLL
jgi:hypothetical protein